MINLARITTFLAGYPSKATGHTRNMTVHDVRKFSCLVFIFIVNCSRISFVVQKPAECFR
jgi:hypothetical protein